MSQATNGSNDASMRELDVIIVGAGFSGLYMLYQLRNQMGLNTRVYEAGDGVGGTWYWNRYPGARCDSESYFYSYSFSEELEQEWDWTSKYPGQPEILRYLNHVADRFELRSHIQFNSRVVEATFNEATNRWEVTLESGERVTAPFLVSGVGCLSAQNVPAFKGLESFEGECHHTSAYPHEGVDFSGKRVGLIGTGSTGIQATPVIAAEADHLTVFQRTPNFSIPARNEPLDPEHWAEIKRNYRDIRQQSRDSGFGFPFTVIERPLTETSAEDVQEILEHNWELGGFRFIFGSFGDVMSDEKANDVIAEFTRNKIRQIVKDPATAEKLCPHGYPLGAKRLPIDTDYFETYNRDNVELIDVREAPIAEITPKGLQLEDGSQFELDTIIFATGFDAMTGSLLKMNITGRGGLSLADKWAEGPKTFLGLQIAGFPNLFTITGPGSPSVLSNMPVAIEQHVDWIADCIRYLREKKLARIEATVDAEENWVDHVREVSVGTVYHKADSWYVGANIPGKKRVFMPYVGGLDQYRDKCDEVARKDYEGFELRTSSGSGPSEKYTECPPLTS